MYFFHNKKSAITISSIELSNEYLETNVGIWVLVDLGIKVGNLKELKVYQGLSFPSKPPKLSFFTGPFILFPLNTALKLGV